MNALISKLVVFIETNRLIITAFSAFIIYYELISNRNCFCEKKKVFLENCKLSNTHTKGNLTIEKSKSSIDQNYLSDLSAKITSL